MTLGLLFNPLTRVLIELNDENIAKVNMREVLVGRKNLVDRFYNFSGRIPDVEPARFQTNFIVLRTDPFERFMPALPIAETNNVALLTFTENMREAVDGYSYSQWVHSEARRPDYYQLAIQTPIVVGTIDTYSGTALNTPLHPALNSVSFAEALSWGPRSTVQRYLTVDQEIPFLTFNRPANPNIFTSAQYGSWH